MSIVGSEEIKDYIEFGASPRATIDMFKAVKARAYLRGNDFVSPLDITLSIVGRFDAFL